MAGGGTFMGAYLTNNVKMLNPLSTLCHGQLEIEMNINICWIYPSIITLLSLLRLLA